VATDSSDSELISACIAGQSWAWDALVDRYKGLIYSIALRSGLTQEDAADVFQTVFAHLLQHLTTIREPQGLAAWLITATKRECWRMLRKRQREPAASEVPLIQTTARGWAESVQSEENLLAWHGFIHEALAQIGERCRQMLTLLYLEPEEPSYDEISARLGLPRGSIGPTRARCLAKMRDLLTKMGMNVK